MSYSGYFVKQNIINNPEDILCSRMFPSLNVFMFTIDDFKNTPSAVAIRLQLMELFSNIFICVAIEWLQASASS